MSNTLSDRRQDALLLILNDVLYRLGFVWDDEKGEYIEKDTRGLGWMGASPSAVIERLLQPDEE